MELYLIRHADAMPLGERGFTDDSDRPLSEKGKAQALSLGEVFRRREIGLELVVTSPLLRARQTAELILQHWSNPPPELLLSAELAPGGKCKPFARFVRASGRDQVAVVGHAPDLGQWAGWLIGGKKARIDVAKAGVVHLTFADGPRKKSGSLVVLLTPEWITA